MKLYFIIGLCTFALCVSGCSTKKQDLPKNHYVHNTVKYQEYPIERTPNTYSPAVCCDDPVLIQIIKKKIMRPKTIVLKAVLLQMWLSC